ncbi:importin-13-like protein [Leptotrombidium deliense]|uniref:Importin-13 n=1 Tax=Leptotrombidium deliense TaxID=299467 RepID=A0A443SWE4_9ACAR|nr:importin-13-like protein [Leptotrombidium deliense]
MELSIESIEKLIFDLYYQPESQSNANKQLTLFQVSIEAWDFCWLLLSANKPLEVQYFGANSLHLKIHKFWHELDCDEKKIALRSKLMETICSYLMEGSLRIVETKLCLSLASYVIKTLSNIWPTAISDLIDNFRPQNLQCISPHKVVHTLVEILTVIPEEFNNNFMSLSERTVCRQALMQNVDRVFSILQSVLQEVSNVDIQQLAVKCFSNWSQNVGPLVLGDAHDSILSIVIDSIRNEELTACCIESINTIYSHPEVHKYPNSILKLIDKIVPFEDILNQAIKEQNMFMCGALYSLFIHTGESHSRLLLSAIIDKPQHKDNILKLITIILQCSGTNGYYPVDETVSEQAFNFWYTFQDDIIASDEGKLATYLSMFSPLYQSLIETLIAKVQYPPDSVFDNDWTIEDKESFRCYRQDIGDTFMYCYNMLRVSMLSALVTHFHVALDHLCRNVHTNTEKPWQHLESVMFALSSIAENVDVEENVYITQIFDSLHRIPFCHIEAPRLVSTLMEMFGSYCEWLYNHQSYLRTVLSLLILGLKSENIAIVTSTMALKDITRECQSIIQPYAEQLLAACEESLRPESPLKPKERSRLMCTVGQILTVMPYDVAMNYLNVLLPPILERLKESLSPDSRVEKQYTNRNTVISHLNMLSMLFATLDPDMKQIDPEEDDEIKVKLKKEINGCHPTFPIFKEVLPLLVGMAAKWMNDETVIDALSECIKRALINLLDFVKPLVMDIMQLTCSVYCTSFQASLLDVLKQIVILFAVDCDLQPYLISFYGQMCNHTVNYCQDVRQKSALIEHFYNVSSSILKKVPLFFRNSNEIDCFSLFRLAIAALVVPEKPTVKAVSNFLTEFIAKSRESENMSRIVNTEGEALIGQVFTVIGGSLDSPRHVVEYMADILMALNQKYFDNFCRWLSFYVQRDGFPTEKATTQEKENFTKLILRERKNKRKVKEMVTQFSLTCRGLIGTEYAQQQIKLPY